MSKTLTAASVAAAAGLTLGWASVARAVIVTGPQGRNLSAPTGDLAGSGWDLEGAYGDYLGTPISPNWFITAAHFGDAGPTITLPDGVVHTLTGAAVQVPGTDLVLRQVSTPFSTYATILNESVDAPLTTADRLTVFGRGTQRGAVIPGHGFEWGDTDHLKSWGTNTFAGKVTITAEEAAAGAGFAAGTAFLTADFSGDAGDDEATLSNGDSGGGVFVERNGEWKLVGINYGVELFRDSPSGPDRYAAISDGRGLYEQNDAGNYAYVDPATTPDPVAQTWFATYVPDTLGTILASPIGVPEPGVMGFVGIAVGLLRRKRKQV